MEGNYSGLELKFAGTLKDIFTSIDDSCSMILNSKFEKRGPLYFDDRISFCLDLLFKINFTQSFQIELSPSLTQLKHNISRINI